MTKVMAKCSVGHRHKFLIFTQFASITRINLRDAVYDEFEDVNQSGT